MKKQHNVNSLILGNLYQLEEDVENIVKTIATSTKADILDQNELMPAIHTVKHARTEPECVQQARVGAKEARRKKARSI